MRVHRLIFRLDFQHPNFDIINSPGTVMRILSDMGEKYWPEFQDDSANRRVTTANKDKEEGTFRQMTVEPTALNFSFESAVGIDINFLDTNETIASLFKGIHALCENFKINEILRAGIRFTILSSIKEGNPSLNTLFGELFDSQLICNVASNLGEIKDFGLAFDGNGLDKLSYHCRFGPYDSSDAQKHFTVAIAKKIEEDGAPANLIFDLDLFEAKFALTVSAAKWSKNPKLKAKKLAEEIEAYLTERL